MTSLMMSSREKGVCQIVQPPISLFSQMNHMTIVYWMTWMANNRSNDLILFQSSFQLNCLQQVGNFMTNKNILVLILLIFRSISYLYPFFNNIANAKGAIWPLKWGVPEVFQYGKILLTLDYFLPVPAKIPVPMAS